MRPAFIVNAHIINGLMGHTVPPSPDKEPLWQGLWFS